MDSHVIKINNNKSEEETKYIGISVSTFLGLSPDHVKKAVFMVRTQASESKSIPLVYLGGNTFGNKLLGIGYEIDRIVGIALVGESDILIPEKLIE